MWKYSTTWEKKIFEDRSFHLQSLPQFLFTQVSPYFCDRSVPFFFLPPPFHFPHFSAQCPHPAILSPIIHLLPIWCPWCSVPQFPVQFSISSFLVSPPKLPSYPSSRRNTHSFSCLSLSCIFIFLPSCLHSLLSKQASSSFSCLVLAKGGRWSLDREVPFSSQSPVQAWPMCLTC